MNEARSTDTLATQQAESVTALGSSIATNKSSSSSVGATLDSSSAHDARSMLRKEILSLRAELPAPYRAHKSAALCDELLLSFDLTVAMTGIAAEDATVAVYAAFPEEVNLHDFIQGVYQRGARVAFPCLVTDAHTCLTFNDTCAEQTMEMRAVSAEDYTNGNVIFLQKQLKKFEHDSAKLAPYPYVSADELTMLVVPVVAFDTAGNRLGYGGGNYDRYLSQLSPAPTSSCQASPAPAGSRQVSSTPTASLGSGSLDSNSQGADLATSIEPRKQSTCRVVGVAFEEQGVASIPIEAHDIPLKILAL